MLAVIKTGGKQYLVSPGQKIKVDLPASLREALQAGKIKDVVGQEVVFSDVLLLEKNKKVDIGCPLVKDVKVIGKVISHGKAKKVIIFKYKAKKRYHVKKGHRQQFTEVEILEIMAK